jgi:hypothetical protein
MTEFLITCAIGAALSMAVLHIEAVQTWIRRTWQAAVWKAWTWRLKK